MRLADFGLTALSYTYHHLGQLTQVTDAAGTRTIGYNAFGEQETDSLLAGDVTHLITEMRDAMGRSTGFTYAYGWDLTKNICEVFSPADYLRTAYTYSPYGEVTADGDVTQPIQWSSEHNDTELALVYYNYRHYNPLDGRWIGRDRIEEWGGLNLYRYAANNALAFFDSLGLDYTVETDEKKCSITFKLVIVLSFDETVPANDQPLIKQQVKNTIESEWSGR